MEPTVISTLAELEFHSAKLDPTVLNPGYVGFDLELSKKSESEIAYMQVSVSNDETIIIKLGEDLKIKDVLLSTFVRSLLESDDISKVGVGISGMF